MPLHIFKCANCQHGNSVDTGNACVCHECEARRPVSTYYRMLTNLIRVAAFVVVIGILSAAASCNITSHFTSKKDLEVLKAEQDSRAALQKVQQEERVVAARNAETAARNAETAKELEIKRLELLRGMKLDDYDVECKMGPDGRMSYFIVPKVKKAEK